MRPNIDSNHYQKDDIQSLTWNEQVNELVHRLETANGREAGIAVMRTATKLGFLEEYRDEKWQPAKGRKGRDAKRIVDAFFCKPRSRVRESNRALYQGANKEKQADPLLRLLNSLDQLPDDHKDAVELIRSLVAGGFR